MMPPYWSTGFDLLCGGVGFFGHSELHVFLLVLLAATPQVGTLVVDAASGDTCLREDAVRAEVRARLGREALVEEASRQFVVRSSAPSSATLVIRQEGGPDAERTFTSSDCRELLESVALAIAVALDPAVFLVVPKRPAPPKPVVSAPEVPAPPSSPSLHVGGGVLAGLALGLAPAPTATAGVFGSLHGGAFGVRLEGRFELPREVVTESQQVSAFSAIGTVSPGWHGRFLRVGLPISVGALFFTSTQGQETFRGSRVVVLVGPEVAARWSLSAWLGLEAFVRAQFVPTRVSVLSGPQTLWVTWPVSVLVGVGLVLGTSDATRE